MAKKLKIGEAIFLDGTSIRISKPDDWGWLYSHNEDDQHFFVLIKIRKSRLIFKKWEAEIIEQNGESPIDTITIDDVQEKNGFPYSFSATIKIGNRTIHAAFNQHHRINLGNRAFLVEDSGYYPTRFFFVLGATGSGKTCWLHALQTESVRDRIFRNSNILYFLNQPEQTRFQRYYLVNKEGGKEKVKEVVFVVELAGEINDLDRQQNSIEMIRQSIKKYASGIFFVRNDEWLFGDRDDNRTDPAEFILRDLMKGSYALTEKDICYILTCADRIKKAIEDDPEKDEHLNIASSSPIFRQTDGSKKQIMDNMADNMAITSSTMRRREELIGNSPCFAVSSCGEVENENGELLLDFGQGYNAELPLVYMLGKGQ